MGNNSKSFWMVHEELFRLSSALILLIFTGFALPIDQPCLKSYSSLTLYNPNTQLCCGGQVYNQTTDMGTKTACCERPGFKAEVYRKGEKICCGVQLTSDFDRNHPPICCNGELIMDTNKYDCCGDRDYGQIYPISSICCTNSAKKKWGIHSSPASDDAWPDCCGVDLYDKNTQVCKPLPDGEFNVTKIYEKCGPEKTRYDPSDQICCDQTGVLLDIPPTETQELANRPKWGCFNNELYDRNINYVHHKANRLIPVGLALCGNDLFSEKDGTKQCCDNVLYTLTPGYNISCCGKELRNLDDNTVQCCDNTIIPISDGCCDNKPYQKGGVTDCCARDLYNKTSSICCRITSSISEVVTKEAANHTDCCADRTYNKYDGQTCHEGKIISSDAIPWTKSSQVKPKPSLSLKPTPRKLATVKPYQICPFCPPQIETNSCNKKNVYALAIYRIKRLERGSLMNAVILSPLLYKGVFVLLKTNHVCSCFKRKKNFHLITNRSPRIRTKLKNSRTASFRFTKDDVFIESNDYSLEKCLEQQRKFQYKKKMKVKTFMTNTVSR